MKREEIATIEDVERVLACINGALGWIAAGTAEGNHIAARDTSDGLRDAAAHLRVLQDRLLAKVEG